MSICAAEDPIEIAKAEHNLGYAEFLSGNLLAAILLMERSAVVLASLSPVARAVGAADRAEVLSACGLVGQAVDALDRAAHAFSLRRIRQSQAEAELAKARILLAFDPKSAASLARRAARRFRSRGSEDWALRAEVVALGGEVSLRPRNATRTATELHPRLRKHKLRVDAQTTALYAASAALAVGELSDTGRWIAKARVRAEDPMETRLLDRQVRARLAGARGRRAGAFVQARAGLDDLHEWLSAFGSLDLQSALVGRGRALAAYGLELATADGRPEVIFEWFERARVLVSRVTPVRAPRSADAEADLAELRRLQGIGADTTELRDRIRQRAWYAPSIGRSAKPAPLADVQAALDTDTLISLVRSENRLTAVVVTAANVHVVPLGAAEPVLSLLATLRADLDMAAADLPDPMARAVRESLVQRLADLSSALFAPMFGVPGDGRLVMVPAGALAGVPWSLLPALRGRPIAIARSATHWLAGVHQASRLARVGFVTGPGVPRAAAEVRHAAEQWDATTVTTALDGAADEVSKVAGAVDVLHVAAHGRHSADNPLFSGIELTGGPWFGYDIDQLLRVPSVVLLSSCELGRSTVRGAEELVGMTTAWLHAGTRCVIAAPVAVNDRVAAELLPSVHRGLASGAPPAEALAVAMTEVDGLAAFACYGSGW
ncbi:MAG: CHAT domain-containing protein [Nocardioides sp.]